MKEREKEEEEVKESEKEEEEVKEREKEEEREEVKKERRETSTPIIVVRNLVVEVLK